MSRYGSSSLYSSHYKPVKQTDYDPDDLNKPHSNLNGYNENLKNLSVYSNDSHDYIEADKNSENSEAIYNQNNQFYGMDPQLAGFVKKYNVVMNDGAVMNQAALAKMASMQIKEKKYVYLNNFTTKLSLFI